MWILYFYFILLMQYQKYYGYKLFINHVITDRLLVYVSRGLSIEQVCAELLQPVSEKLKNYCFT